MNLDLFLDCLYLSTPDSYLLSILIGPHEINLFAISNKSGLFLPHTVNTSNSKGEKNLKRNYLSPA